MDHRTIGKGLPVAVHSNWYDLSESKVSIVRSSHKGSGKTTMLAFSK